MVYCSWRRARLCRTWRSVVGLRRRSSRVAPLRGRSRTRCRRPSTRSGEERGGSFHEADRPARSVGGPLPRPWSAPIGRARPAPELGCRFRTSTRSTSPKGATCGARARARRGLTGASRRGSAGLPERPGRRPRHQSLLPLRRHRLSRALCGKLGSGRAQCARSGGRVRVAPRGDGRLAAAGGGLSSRSQCRPR